MLSIAQSDLGYYCFEWTATEQGPRIVHSKFVKIIKNFDEQSTFNKIIKSFSPKLKEESKSLSIIIHNNQINISSFEVSSDIRVGYYINWYEENILGEEYLNEFDNYYYPMESEKSNIYLIISIKKIYKDSISDATKKLGFNLVYLSVNLFSAAITAKQIFKLKKNEDFLVWKVDKNNYHYFTYYYNDNLGAFIKAKLNKKSIEVMQEIGCPIHLNKITVFINDFIIRNKKFNIIKNIFIYQVKDNHKYIKEIANSKKCNVQILDISRLFEDKTNTFMQYVENGISIKGIDV